VVELVINNSSIPGITPYGEDSEDDEGCSEDSQLQELVRSLRDDLLLGVPYSFDDPSDGAAADVFSPDRFDIETSSRPSVMVTDNHIGCEYILGFAQIMDDNFTPAEWIEEAHARLQRLVHTPDGSTVGEDYEFGSEDEWQLSGSDVDTDYLENRDSMGTSSSDTDCTLDSVDVDMSDSTSSMTKLIG
jgi:hypothetical protein